MANVPGVIAVPPPPVPFASAPPPHVVQNDNSSNISSLCAVCLDNKPNMLYRPCKHCSVCENCHTEGEFGTCPMCNTEIKHFEKIFIN